MLPFGVLVAMKSSEVYPRISISRHRFLEFTLLFPTTPCPLAPSHPSRFLWIRHRRDYC